MNKVEAFIRPEKLDNVKDALANEGILGLSVIQVTGRGVQRGVRTGGRGTQSYMASMLDLFVKTPRQPGARWG